MEINHLRCPLVAVLRTAPQVWLSDKDRAHIHSRLKPLHPPGSADREALGEAAPLRGQVTEGRQRSATELADLNSW